MSVGTTDEEPTGQHELPEVPLWCSFSEQGGMEVVSNPELKRKKLPVLWCEVLGR